MQHCQQQTPPPNGKSQGTFSLPPTQPKGSCLQSVDMSKICLCALKHSLRTRSPSAWVLAAGNNSQMGYRLLVEISSAFEGCFAMPISSDFFGSSVTPADEATQTQTCLASCPQCLRNTSDLLTSLACPDSASCLQSLLALRATSQHMPWALWTGSFNAFKELTSLQILFPE